MDLSTLVTALQRICEPIGTVNVREITVSGTILRAVTLANGKVKPEGSMIEAFYCTVDTACSATLDNFKAVWMVSGSPDTMLWRSEPEIVEHTQSAIDGETSTYYAVVMRVIFLG